MASYTSLYLFSTSGAVQLNIVVPPGR